MFYVIQMSEGVVDIDQIKKDLMANVMQVVSSAVQSIHDTLDSVTQQSSQGASSEQTTPTSCSEPLATAENEPEAADEDECDLYEEEVPDDSDDEIDWTALQVVKEARRVEMTGKKDEQPTQAQAPVASTSQVQATDVRPSVTAEDLLAEYTAVLERTETGPPIDADVAKLAEAFVKGKLPDQKVKELLDKFLPPANCTLIDTVRLNPVISKIVSERVRTQDRKWQREQTVVAKSMAGLLSAMDDIKKADLPQISSAFGKLTEVMALLATHNIALTNQRREAMKGDIGMGYQSLCYRRIEASNLLFGDKLEEDIKALGDSLKIKSQVQRAGYPQGMSRGRSFNRRGRGQGRFKPYTTDDRQSYVNKYKHPATGFHRGRGQSRGRGSYRGKKE